jgi:fumarate reductase subunit C
MILDDAILSLTGRDREKKKSRIPARLDYWQSATGLFLALFMIAHMLFVSTILISEEVMYKVTKFFEADFLIEGGSPVIVSVMVVVVFTIFILHALLAMRKFPISYRELLVLKTYAKLMNHADTKLWIIQVFTGFAMFFMGSVHLYIMLTQPESIGPYGSADRVFSDGFWPLYLMLLFAVELHGAIGLYRLSVKWGWFDGNDPKTMRKKLKWLKSILSVFMLTLGLLTLAAYMKIGYEHQSYYGERYHTVKDKR